MATAVDVTYTIPEGGNVYCGMPMPLAAWYEDTPTGEWVALPNSTLSSSGVGWAGTAPGGTGNYQTVVTAWSGGVLNTTGLYINSVFVEGTFLVIFGGGHGDYAGNELYAYGPLEVDAPEWHRLNDPTIPAPNDVARISGYPCSRHTYDTLVYLPTQNRMLCIGAPGYYSIGSARNQGDLFDFNVDPAVSNPWIEVDTGFPAFTGGGTINLVSGYDTVSGYAWGIGQGNGSRLCRFDPTSDTWSSWSKDNPSGPSNFKAAVGGSTELLVFMNGDDVIVQDLTSPNSSLYTPTCTGTPPTSPAAMNWDEDNWQFIVKEGGSNKTIFFLTPGADYSNGGDDWVWTSTTPSDGATPAAITANGIFGRAQLNPAPLMKGVVWMPTHDQPIYYYKM